MSAFTRPELPSLPDFYASIGEWTQALAPRLDYVEKALNGNNTDEMVDAQNVILEYVTKCPPGYDKLREVGQKIYAIDLANTDQRIKDLQANLDKYKAIGGQLAR